MRSFATSKLMATMALAAGAASVAALGASPAAAATSTRTHDAVPASVRHAPYIGEVIARIPLNIRAAATTNSAVLGSYAPGTVIHIKCKVNGQNIDGNPRWYKLYYRTGWVAARYVENIGAAPSWC